MPPPAPVPAGPRTGRCRLLLPVLLGGIFLPLAPIDGDAGCPVERAASKTALRVHLAATCSEAEREAHALAAAELLTALTEGRSLDLAGVIVQGDLLLDAVPERRPADVPVPDDLRPIIDARRAGAFHVVEGGIRIERSVVRGALKSNLHEDLLLVRGPVILTGTIFEQSLDLSRTVLLGPIDLSGAVLQQQGFFIEAAFAEPARFVETSFGVHSRFHKATFSGPVDFRAARFNGLAEFLEVTFGRGAVFAGAQFKMGTGFSGSRFAGPADFTETVFEREAFFAFATFAGDAVFRRATFRSDANFSEADFQGADDFSKAVFNSEPRFTRAKMSGGAPARTGFADARLLYLLAALLLAGSLVFVFILARK